MWNPCCFWIFVVQNRTIIVLGVSTYRWPMFFFGEKMTRGIARFLWFIAGFETSPPPPPFEDCCGDSTYCFNDVLFINFILSFPDVDGFVCFWLRLAWPHFRSIFSDKEFLPGFLLGIFGKSSKKWAVTKTLAICCMKGIILPSFIYRDYNNPL